MAKTLGKLRQQTLKLRELQAPSDTSKGTKNFVKKHVYTVHPDANENDDDVFKATNVKKAKRFPDHGYENGQDADVYEARSYGEQDSENQERRRLSSRAERNRREASYARGKRDRYPNEGEVANSFEKRTGLKWKREVPKRDEKLARSFDFKADEAEKQAASLRRKTNLANSYEHDGEESNLDEMSGLSKTEKARTTERNREGGNLNHGEFKRTASGLRVSKEKKTQVRRMGREDAEFRRSEDSRLKQMNREETEIDEVFGFSKKEKAKKAAKKMMNSGPWKRAEDAMKATSSNRYWGKKNEAYDDTNEFGETHLETRNFEHNYLHSHISDHIEAIHKTIQAHVKLMDSMNDHQHEGNFRQLLKTHDALEDLSHKIQRMHTNAKTRMGMHPKAEPVRDMSDRPMVGAAFPHAEGYEHIAALTESDQALLVDTYNSLSEENQDRFLELAETEEGVDELIDFAIKQRAE